MSHELGWHAELDLAFARSGGRTVLTRRDHRGPLLVQRAFYPEDNGTCHVYIVHPPGGVVGGDRLTITTDVGADAAALVTTPAAGKYYRTEGPDARQEQRLTVGPGAMLEWFPQETIIFDGAQVHTRTRVALADTASFVGWESYGTGG